MFRLLGHMKRMSDDRCPIKPLDWIVLERRRQERPRRMQETWTARGNDGMEFRRGYGQTKIAAGNKEMSAIDLHWW